MHALCASFVSDETSGKFLIMLLFFFSVPEFKPFDGSSTKISIIVFFFKFKIQFMLIVIFFLILKLNKSYLRFK